MGRVTVAHDPSAREDAGTSPTYDVREDDDYGSFSAVWST
jgi:hypothetical protein